MKYIPTYNRCSLMAVLVALCLYAPTASATAGRNHGALQHPAPRVPAYAAQQQGPTPKQDVSSGQKPAITESNSVNIRPTVGSTKRGVPVEVVVNKTRVRVLEKVNFTLVPKNRVANARFTVNFGDGNEIQTTRTQVEHEYKRVGHYDVFAWLTPDRGTPTDPDSPPQKVPGVSLSATPTAVSPGGSVTFVAELDPRSPNIKYRFGFGDGELTEWQDSPKTERAYNSQGTYSAYVDIGLGNRGAVRQIGRSTRVAIRVTQPVLRTVDLTVNPNPAEVGMSVTFTAVVVPQAPNFVYRFSFGDGSATTGWQASPQTAHSYTSARPYPASVDIGMTNGGIVKPMGSARETVSVTQQPSTPTPTPTPTPSASPSPSATGSPLGNPSATPSPSASPTVVPPFLVTTPSPNQGGNGPWGLPFGPDDWWKYVLLALAIAGAAYWGWKALFPPRPSFTARPDPGGADVNAGAQPLAIESQVILNPDVSAGQYLVYSDEPSIVRSVRRDNG